MLDLSRGKAGLGPDNWGEIRKYFPGVELFYDCACYHDYQYEIGELEREKIDKQFLEMMLEKQDLQIIAYCYYGFVRTFGWIFYKNK